MDKNESLSIIQLITTYYPNFKVGDVRLTLDAWHGILKDYDVDEIGNRLIEYVKSGEQFPPIVGQLLPTKKEIASRYVPNAEETKLMLQEQEQKNLLALEDPNREEAKAKAQEEIRKTLGIERG